MQNILFVPTSKLIYSPTNKLLLLVMTINGFFTFNALIHGCFLRASPHEGGGDDEKLNKEDTIHIAEVQRSHLDHMCHGFEV